MSSSSSQWIFEPEHLESTPSHHHGIPSSRELTLRKDAIILTRKILITLPRQDTTKSHTFQEQYMNKGRKSIKGGYLMGRTETEHEHFLSISREFESLWVEKLWSFVVLAVIAVVLVILMLFGQMWYRRMAKDVEATAATYIHRFYMRYSIESFKLKVSFLFFFLPRCLERVFLSINLNPMTYPGTQSLPLSFSMAVRLQQIAATCLYLALKVEDRMNIKLRSIATVASVLSGSGDYVSSKTISHLLEPLKFSKITPGSLSSLLLISLFHFE